MSSFDLSAASFISLVIISKMALAYGVFLESRFYLIDKNNFWIIIGELVILWAE